MRNLVLRIMGAGAIFLGLTLSAGAQTDDHLKCYKIKDPLKLKGVVDLDGVQFGLEAGCKVGKAQLFCVPVTKNVQEAFNKKTSIDPLPIFGPAIKTDSICYPIKCQKPQIPPTTVTDQFGSRTIEFKKAFMLCTPAFKGVPPPIPCENSDFPTCAGECADATLECLPQFNADGTPGKCDCQPPPTPCALSANGVCGGDCPVATDICQWDQVAQICDCGPTLGKCTDSLFPTCSGPCPLGQICTNLPGSDLCDCQDQTQLSCSDTKFPQCNGPCPTGQACTVIPGTIDCNCQDVSTNCANTTFPMCAGPCPLGQVCKNLQGSDACDCQPESQFTCNAGTGFPECNGTCPQGEACLPDIDPLSPGVCGCAPAGFDCGSNNLPPPVCGGLCAPDQFCDVDTVTGLCRCTQ